MASRDTDPRPGVVSISVSGYLGHGSYYRHWHLSRNRNGKSENTQGTSLCHLTPSGRLVVVLVLVLSSPRLSPFHH